jgi:hypothetical protein
LGLGVWSELLRCTDPADLDVIWVSQLHPDHSGDLLAAHQWAAGCRDTLRYEHRRAGTEQLLALTDAIAWCWAKGGYRRRRIEHVVAEPGQCLWAAPNCPELALLSTILLRSAPVGPGWCTQERAGRSVGP